MKKLFALLSLLIIVGCSATSSSAENDSYLKVVDNREFNSPYRLSIRKMYDEETHCYFYISQDSSSLQMSEPVCP